MSKVLSIKGAFALFVGLSFAFLGIQFAFAGHNGAVIDIDELACGETTFTASIAEPEGSHVVSNMYLVVHADGETEYVNVPTDGTGESITVGPFDEDTTISWNVFGGGERDYDNPSWNGYGDPDFNSDVADYAAEQSGYGWVLDGPGNPNPFTNWNELDVEGCDEEAPVVEIDSPADDSSINGLVDITGSVMDNVELSHYNLSLYPDTTDLSDGDTHAADRLNDSRWCTTPTSGTVNLSDDFTGELCEDWDTTQYDDGDYQIRLAARDAAGNLDGSDAFTGGTSSVHVIDVTIDNDPDAKNDCKRGGWEDYGFRNQGQCIRYVNTGMDSR